MVSYDYLVFELASVRLKGQTWQRRFFKKKSFVVHFHFGTWKTSFQQTFLKLWELSAC
jgi:hypothetical protein